MREDGIEPELPQIEGLAFLVADWDACGRHSAGMPTEWRELKAYGALHGLNEAELQIMRRMSIAYLEGLAMTSRLSVDPMESALGH